MDQRQRTLDVYEHIAAFPSLPLLPLADLSDLSSLAKVGVKLTPASRKLISYALRLSGFASFRKRLPGRIEELLRTTHLRGEYLFAPIVSASLALRDDSQTSDPLVRAAALIAAARSLHQDIMSGALQPDRHGNDVLEMGLYPNLFSTCLVVENGEARMFKTRVTSKIAILVCRRIYIVEIGDTTNPLSVRELASALALVVHDARRNPLKAADAPPGLLTCADHSRQIKTFTALAKDPRNRESLAAIRDTLFTLCLDLDAAPASDAEAAHCAHTGNCANRWFHSSLQVVVFGNSKSAAICNFSTYLSGNTMMRAASELVKRAEMMSFVSSGSRLATEPPRALEFNIPSTYSRLAQKDLATVLDHQLSATFEIPGFGKASLQPLGLRSVPTFVLALQMALLRLVGPAKINQFLSMSKYRYMDLSDADVTTPEMLRAAECLNSAAIDQTGARPLLDAAFRSHANACAEGRRALPLTDLFGLFSRTATAWRRRWASGVFIVTAASLRALGCLHLAGRDVIISDPSVMPEVPVVGRPGVRLPYVKYLGLHFQVLEDKTLVTFMPGTNFTISNSEFASVLRESAATLLEGVSRAGEVHAKISGDSRCAHG